MKVMLDVDFITVEDDVNPEFETMKMLSHLLDKPVIFGDLGSGFQVRKITMLSAPEPEVTGHVTFDKVEGLERDVQIAKDRFQAAEAQAAPRPVVGALAVIVGVALQAQDGTVYSLPKPHRHHHLLRQRALEGDTHTFNYTQGFVTEDGTFLNRQDALTYVTSVGQLTVPIIGGDLTSEDLW